MFLESSENPLQWSDTKFEIKTTSKGLNWDCNFDYMFEFQLKDIEQNGWFNP